MKALIGLGMLMLLVGTVVAVPGNGNAYANGKDLAPGQSGDPAVPNGHPVADAPNDAPGQIVDGNYGQSHAPGPAV